MAKCTKALIEAELEEATLIELDSKSDMYDVDSADYFDQRLEWDRYQQKKLDAELERRQQEKFDEMTYSGDAYIYANY